MKSFEEFAQPFMSYCNRVVQELRKQGAPEDFELDISLLAHCFAGDLYCENAARLLMRIDKTKRELKEGS